MATRDWNAVKQEYIAGEISMRDLAKKHKISWGAMCAHALGENWKDQRDLLRDKSDTEAILRIEADLTERRYTALEVCDAIIDKFMASIDTTQKVTAFDAMNAARFKEVLRGGIESRTESINRAGDGWREGLDAEEVKQIEEWANIGRGDDSGEVQSGEA
jgi:hypothetical protein